MTGNRLFDAILIVLAVIVIIYLFFILLDKLDQESAEAFFDAYLLEIG